MFYLHFWQHFCNLRPMDDPKIYLGTTTPLPNAQTGKAQWNVCSPAPLQGAREGKVPQGDLKQQVQSSRKCLVSYSLKIYWKDHVNLLLKQSLFAEGRDLRPC